MLYYSQVTLLKNTVNLLPYWNYTLQIRERINNQIRAAEVRVISSTGENLGILSLKDAQSRADSEGLESLAVFLERPARAPLHSHLASPG